MILPRGSGPLPVDWMLLYIHRNHRLIRDGSPGQPPQLFTQLLSSDPSFCFRLFLFFKLEQAVPMVSRVIPVSASNTSPLLFLFHFGFCWCLLACLFWFCSYEYIHKCLLCAFTNLGFLWKLDELVHEEKRLLFFRHLHLTHIVGSSVRKLWALGLCMPTKCDQRSCRPGMQDER